MADGINEIEERKENTMMDTVKKYKEATNAIVNALKSVLREEERAPWYREAREWSERLRAKYAHQGAYSSTLAAQAMDAATTLTPEERESLLRATPPKLREVITKLIPEHWSLYDYESAYNQIRGYRLYQERLGDVPCELLNKMYGRARKHWRKIHTLSEADFGVEWSKKTGVLI